VWLIDNSTVVTNNDNIHAQWRVIGTVGHNMHNALLVFTHRSRFLGCNVHANE